MTSSAHNTDETIVNELRDFKHEHRENFQDLYQDLLTEDVTTPHVFTVVQGLSSRNSFVCNDSIPLNEAPVNLSDWFTNIFPVAAIFPLCSRTLPMPSSDPLEDSHRRRSDFVRTLVQRSIDSATTFSELAIKPPHRIVQFWDDLNRLPDDVRECITTWKNTDTQGFDRLIFDKLQARDFIRQKLGQRHTNAYDKCYHPAMQSDYFRLCYIFVEGGCYIDADDAYKGTPIQYLCGDGRLKLQPLCYDMATNMMVSPSLFTKPGANSIGWIFYFNSNPLIAGRGHPLIDRALAQATLSLEKDMTNGLPEIQSTAGPGNLTKSIFDAATEGEAVEQSVLVLRDWEHTAESKWPLSYRNDTRNWRLSNCRTYQEADVGNV